jgi:hypothetical protein
MGDDHHRIASTGESSSDILGGRSRREPIVGLGLDVQRPGQFATRFARAKKGAREDRLRPGQLVPDASAQLARLPTPLRRQRPELVRFSRRSLGVADEVQAHCR